MAVQAQLPSNFLFLNRSVQEINSLHPFSGSGGVFIDETEMICNHRVDANSRKRGREQSNPMISLQSHHQQQLIDLPQLYTSPPSTAATAATAAANGVSTGLQLAFGDHHQQQLQQHRQQQQYSVSPQSSQSSVLLSVLAEDLGTQIKHQRDEIENYLRAQAELMRRALEEKRQRHYRALLGAAEESLTRRLREKEAEVEKATRLHAELEARASQLTAEAQAWQARARAQELTAAALHAQLQTAAANGVNSAAGNNAQGCSAAADGGREAEDAESAYVDPDRVEVSGAWGHCRACRRRVASVVVLPCRHLCLCTRCDVVSQACPLCLCVKGSSVEVFLC